MRVGAQVREFLRHLGRADRCVDRRVQLVDQRLRCATVLESNRSSPRVSSEPYKASAGWLDFGAANQLNGATGTLLNIAANSRINLLGYNQTISGLTGGGLIQLAENAAHFLKA